MKPTPEQIQRGAGALVPFVRERKLPLNPEDLEELAYAVLRHHDTDEPWEQVEAEVREQLVEWKRERDDFERVSRGRRSK